MPTGRHQAWRAGRAVLASFAFACGCGGSIDRTAQMDEGGSGGAAETVNASGGAVGPSSGEAGALPSGGAGDASGGNGGSSLAGGGFVAGSAGLAETPAVQARAKSGTRFCLDDRDCNGLTCTASLGRVQSACLAPCVSDADCKQVERCFSQPSIPTSCFHRCVSPVDCDYQYDCADYYGTGDYLCLPSDWVRYWAPAKP